MAEVVFSVREFVFGNILYAVGRRTIVHHLDFRQRVGIPQAGGIVRNDRGARRLLPAAASDDRQLSRMLEAVAVNREALLEVVNSLAVAVLADGLLKQLKELIFQLRQLYAVLRALRPGDARLNLREV